MPTNTAGTTARTLYTNQIGVISRAISFSDASAAVQTIGQLPAGAVVLGAGVVVSTAFTTSTKTLDIGTAADPDGFATALALGTIGKIEADELATSDDLGPYAADTNIVCTPTLSGGSNTAGVGTVYVTFFRPNTDPRR